MVDGWRHDEVCAGRAKRHGVELELRTPIRFIGELSTVPKAIPVEERATGVVERAARVIRNEKVADRCVRNVGAERRLCAEVDADAGGSRIAERRPRVHVVVITGGEVDGASNGGDGMDLGTLACIAPIDVRIDELAGTRLNRAAGTRCSIGAPQPKALASVLVNPPPCEIEVAISAIGGNKRIARVLVRGANPIVRTGSQVCNQRKVLGRAVESPQLATARNTACRKVERVAHHRESRWVGVAAAADIRYFGRNGAVAVP